MDRIQTIKQAYEYCERVTRHHARSFYFAARFLPAPKRRAVYPIYAFCRHVDDAIDEAEDNSPDVRREVVRIWESRLRDVFSGTVEVSNLPTERELVFVAFRNLLEQYRFSIDLPLDLIKGVLQDTEIDRYRSFDDLYIYCYRVASTVGLMSSEILGYADEAALDHAEALGIAMQLTNILRDVSEDAARGRIYLPQDDLDRFGVTENQIFEGRIDGNFRNLFRFEIERARDYYRRGNDGIKYLSRDSQFTVSLASTAYSAILDQIESMDYDVFSSRAHTTKLQKIAMLPRVWLGMRGSGGR